MADKELRKILMEARLRLLRLHHEANAGHIGGNFSCLDCLVLLYNRILGRDDRALLSKGHSAGALYVALWSAGHISEETLTTFTKDDTLLGVHPPVNGFDIIPFGTGSLGHGPSLTAGLALAKKLKNEPGRVFCVSSDGEWQEGSCWEALAFAVHRKLDNLRIVIDVNGWQGFGSTEEVGSVDLDRLRKRVDAFGAEAIVCDGHDLDVLRSVLERGSDGQGRPLVALMRTRKACGIPDFENTLKSHYLPLGAELYERARRAVEEEFSNA
jgi:transketolase